MAAIVAADGFDLAVLRTHLAARLPGYARPLFVRLCERLALTGTFKLSKADLAREGWADAGDPVWLDDAEAGGFVRLNESGRQRLAGGSLRL